MVKVTKEAATNRNRNVINDSEGVTAVKTSSVSSVVKSVKKNTELPRTCDPVNIATRGRPRMEGQSSADSSPTSDDASIVKIPVRNVVKKGMYFCAHCKRHKLCFTIIKYIYMYL